MMLGNLFRHTQTNSRHFFRYLSSKESPISLRWGEGSSKKVAIVELNCPEALNAMTVELGNAFQQTINQLSLKGDSVGAVVITGAGRAFSAGGDFDFLQARSEDSPSRNVCIMRAFYDRFLCVRKLPFPVIAAINGHAIGAGLCLALACDIRVAKPDAKMGFTFVGLGLHPGMGATHFLPKLIGSQNATEMLLTGDIINGESALENGLVSHIAKDPLEHAVCIATRMANAAPVSVRTCLKTLRETEDANLEIALQKEAAAQAQCYASLDYKEGVAALRERRKPVFQQYEQYQEIK